MILIGEIEYNEPRYHPDGCGPSYLWMGAFDGSFYYSISTSDRLSHIGDNTVSRYHLSAIDFLKQVAIGTDDMWGRSNGKIIVSSRENAKVRLKGMTEWITN